MTTDVLLSIIAPDLATLLNKDGAIFIAESQTPQCRNRDLAVAYLAAHILATSKTNGAGAVSGMSEGKSINDISKEIKERYGVTKSRARTIARTEVGKLNGNLTKVRNQELGIKTYTWVTANDGERVRPSHRELHNLLCRWDNDRVYSDDNGKSWKRRSGKMFIGKPGDDINCRCTSRANVNQLLEELGI